MNIRRSIKSFRFAAKGIADLFRTQSNAQIHLIAAGLAVAAGLFLGLTHIEWSIVTICIFMVISMEAANTAIEYLTDLVSPEFHPLAGKAKDAAAAAVLIAAIGAVIAGAIIFLPKIWRLVAG